MILLYGFCKRWKYSDIKCEADLEEPDQPGQPSYTEKILNDNTVANWWELLRMCVGQDMADRNSTHKIRGVGLEVEIDESLFGGVKYGRGNPFRHR